MMEQKASDLHLEVRAGRRWLRVDGGLIAVKRVLRPEEMNELFRRRHERRTKNLFSKNAVKSTLLTLSRTASGVSG